MENSTNPKDAGKTGENPENLDFTLNEKELENVSGGAGGNCGEIGSTNANCTKSGLPSGCTEIGGLNPDCTKAGA
jgi:bacteriocin-like protein